MKDEEDMSESRLQSEAEQDCLKPHDSSLKPPSGRMNPLALTIADAARLLSKAGGRVITPQQVEADVAAGLPLNPDGTFSLITYAAWLSQVRSLETGVRRNATSYGRTSQSLQPPPSGLQTHAH